MACAVGKVDNLRLYAGAVARADALYLTVVKWRVAERSAEYVMASFVGIEDVTGALSQMTPLHREEAEASRLLVAWLLLYERPIYGAPIDAGWGTRFHTIGVMPRRYETLRDTVAGWL